jgi:hypothetical protein
VDFESLSHEELGSLAPRCELVAGRSLKVFAEVTGSERVAWARSGPLTLLYFSAVLPRRSAPESHLPRPLVVSLAAMAPRWHVSRRERGLGFRSCAGIVDSRASAPKPGAALLAVAGAPVRSDEPAVQTYLSRRFRGRVNAWCALDGVGV